MNQPARHLRRPEVPAGAPARHLRVVDRPGRSAASRRRRARAVVVTTVGGIAGVMFCLVYLHVVLAQRQLELNQLSSTLTTDTARYQSLRLRVAEMESPQRIISVAEGQLGMRPPASVTYVSPPSTAPSVSTAAGAGSAATARPTEPGTVAAPDGDADWPVVKAALAGLP